MVSTLGTIAVFCIIALLAILEIRPKVNDKFVKESSYPVDAATYITENLDLKSIRLFNGYNYGSYLIFRRIPVFIDSRADLYAPEFNKIKDSQDEELAKKYDLRAGMGLSMCQIGIMKRIFVVSEDNGDGTFERYVVINPKVLSHSEELIYVGEGEGCLSVYREVKGIVPRYARMKINLLMKAECSTLLWKMI